MIAVPDQVPQDQKDDELLVIVTKPLGQHAPWVQQLIQDRFTNLDKSHHYSRYYVGFRGQSGEKPYLILDWQKDGQSALERRWVAGRLYRFITNQFKTKKILIYLASGCGLEQLTIAEDVAMAGTKSRYEKSRWAYIKVLTPDAAEFARLDPAQKIRQKRCLEYRQWLNENPDEMTSIAIGERLHAFAKNRAVTVETLEEKELKALGMNLLLAVGQASSLSPSRLHLASYGLDGKTPPLLLVGKGVTFDTGGINVKPHESHVNCMKNDMGGAALMSQLFMALVEANYDGPLVLAVPACENLVAEKSMKPGAIIKSHKGKDVLIEHTDAEGRLILADAISYAQEKFSPAQTWVAATLTTAALRQFTNFFTPVHFASDAAQEKIRAAASQWGEGFTFWDPFLPFLQGNMSPAADLTNMGRMPGAAAGGGGSNVAAHFLKEFSDGPMVHFDIFASAWNWSNDYPGAHYGATGAPFHSLFAALHQGAGKGS